MSFIVNSMESRIDSTNRLHVDGGEQHKANRSPESQVVANFSVLQRQRDLTYVTSNPYEKKSFQN